MKNVPLRVLRLFVHVVLAYGILEVLSYIFVGHTWNPLGLDANRSCALFLLWMGVFCACGLALERHEAATELSRSLDAVESEIHRLEGK